MPKVFSCLFAVLSLLLLLSPPTLEARSPKVQLGIDVLVDNQFDLIRDKRVGLLTHPAGVDRHSRSTVEILYHASAVNLVALFGPEHGIYGDEAASVPVDDRIDHRTGLPVYSLYGRYRKPTPAMLRGLDVMVIDLQDVGVRSYTFVSAMRLTIEACFENGVEVVVLDRPNPLGGLKVDGPPLDREWRSYVGAYHVPYVHGLTIGELARISVSRRNWLEIPDEVRREGRLHVVRMRGWRRDMRWEDTGLEWIPTSPFVPTVEAAEGYAMTGLGAQIGGFQHGIGTQYPFRHIRFRGQPLEAVERELRRANIPGVQFRRTTARTSAGTPVEGFYVEISDWERFRPTELSFHMMRIACRLRGDNPFAAASANDRDLFNKHVGSTAWWDALVQHGPNVNVEYFIHHWEQQSERFKQAAQRYWLYSHP
ncbi:MAG: DUF1343 domain-containing protein [Opitutales bacterium]|nr:DUF1343 domain-containing protein [Opitutales bacterium]